MTHKVQRKDLRYKKFYNNELRKTHFRKRRLTFANICTIGERRASDAEVASVKRTTASCPCGHLCKSLS